MQLHKKTVTPSGDAAEKQFFAFDFNCFLLVFIVYNQTEVLPEQFNTEFDAEHG